MDENEEGKTRHEEEKVNETAPLIQPLQTTAIELARAILTPETLNGLIDAALTASHPAQAHVFTTPILGFPTNGNSFALLSSGDASQATITTDCDTCFNAGGMDTVTLNLTFALPLNPGNLTFDWKFATEEEQPTSYNDFFNVLVNGVPIPGFPQTVNTALLALTDPDDVCYDFSTPAIQTSIFDLSPFAGQVITISLQVSDSEDCSVDSAALIDNLNIEGCGLPAIPAPTPMPTPTSTRTPCPVVNPQTCCQIIVENLTQLISPALRGTASETKTVEASIEAVCPEKVVICGVIRKTITYTAVFDDGRVEENHTIHDDVDFKCFIDREDANEGDEFHVTGAAILCTVFAEERNFGDHPVYGLHSLAFKWEEKDIVKVCIRKGPSSN